MWSSPISSTTCHTASRGAARRSSAPFVAAVRAASSRDRRGAGNREPARRTVRRDRRGADSRHTAQPDSRTRRVAALVAQCVTRTPGSFRGVFLPNPFAEDLGLPEVPHPPLRPFPPRCLCLCCAARAQTRLHRVRHHQQQVRRTALPVQLGCHQRAGLVPVQRAGQARRADRPRGEVPVRTGRVLQRGRRRSPRGRNRRGRRVSRDAHGRHEP